MENKNHVILDIENLTAAFQIHKSRVVAVRGVSLYMEDGRYPCDCRRIRKRKECYHEIGYGNPGRKRTGES